ncbi:hypothetical protein chiPu_0007161 [Chiloscyllium punctatum]|uniref:Uncharacterized protein n=1 Tax=Chiloscyllium punctatum TaxID=137246 RepID=A0A401SE90_CHIPU|nr:hypothetical protein [Chiloscyllium punctatum]
MVRSRQGAGFKCDAKGRFQRKEFGVGLEEPRMAPGCRSPLEGAYTILFVSCIGKASILDALEPAKSNATFPSSQIMMLLFRMFAIS